MDGFDPVRDAAQITGDLAALGTAERAESEQAYLKSELEHFGTSVPNIRSVAKAYLKSHPHLTHAQLRSLVDELWSAPIHERRMASVELLVARVSLLDTDDLGWLESLLRTSFTWALVDTLAGTIVARIVDAEPGGLEVLDRWLADDDMWIRRSAVLGLRLSLRNGRELQRFFWYADVLLVEREFFIRKVLGWVAREVGQRQPAAISTWLRANLDRMNLVTLREAVKYLPDGDQIVEAWRRNKVG
ncbi:MAG: alkylation repair enzyme [Ilumatobacteraceae bacterium]|nr:alkylation repair enzyme [Ilumatobacteraceae bacterium]